MANRLTRITTRTGDDGSTGLGDGAYSPTGEQHVTKIPESTLDLLFVLCRIINRDAGIAESYWHPGHII